MRYVSTRGEAAELGFQDVLLAGLARDGGLYLPKTWPEFSAGEIRAMRGASFQDIAFEVFAGFVDGEIAPSLLRAMIDEAYSSFRHKAIAPLVQTDSNSFILELFHGPTLAFKDVAMQLLARLMDHALAERDERATIIGATSGDTGAAAIEAFSGRERTDIFILFPQGRVSPVQQRQMTTSPAGNARAIAITGDFDDCQNIVKAMFNDARFRDQVNLSGVNSINWARIMPQIVYYFTAAVSLGAPDRPISFAVPTGNFGDIFAGYAAKRMGLPIERLIIATNENDILARALATGRYELEPVVATTSPSMDIQISSNFERLLFEVMGREAARVRLAMDSLKQSGAFVMDETALGDIRRLFSADRASENETAATIATMLEETGYLIDPHTAVGVHVASKLDHAADIPLVTLATAHPAKFPVAVKSACGIDPALPSWLCDLMTREEHYDVLPADLDTVEAAIAGLTRAGR